MLCCPQTEKLAEDLAHAVILAAVGETDSFTGLDISEEDVRAMQYWGGP